MEVEQLCKMANQIASYYASEPNREEALTSIATHLRRFWDPRMRRQLLQYLDETGGHDLSPIALEAINAHRSLVQPPAAPV
ncbi:MAG TPA: formate dehydrogenase subunit delta [Gemmatimonadaceae bacterium]|nr:formate dehydrogenase subunit delta [Gemmatimonadaceae bacterium]